MAGERSRRFLPPWWMAGAVLVLLAAAAIAVVAPRLSAARAPAVKVERTVSLAAGCATCHGTDGRSVDAAIPSLAGVTAEWIVQRTLIYRSPVYGGALMHHLVQGYEDDEIQAIADFFAALGDPR